MASLEPATSAALSAEFRDDWNAMLSPSHARCGERRWTRAMEYLLAMEAERLDVVRQKSMNELRSGSVVVARKETL
jgi:hypothetical protein